MSILFFLLGTVRRWLHRREAQRTRATIRRLEIVCRLNPDELAARLGAGKERS